MNYHRVPTRRVWSSRAVSQVLLQMLVSIFVSHGPLVMGLDDTIEHGGGEKIKAKGIYRDPVRSSHSHFVKASGLRWLSLMLLVEIPWAQRVWALPFLTALAPDERYNLEHKHRHKTLTDWGRQMLLQVRRWLPKRELVVACDSSFALIGLSGCTQSTAESDPCNYPLAMAMQPCINRLLLESVKQMGRPRRKGKRLPNLTNVLASSETDWQTVTVNPWYGEGKREVARHLWNCRLVPYRNACCSHSLGISAGP